VVSLDTTKPITAGIREIVITLFQAVGLVILVAFAAVLGGAVVEIGERAWKRVKGALFGTDPHLLHLPDLGRTMADGGEKKDGDEKRKA